MTRTVAALLVGIVLGGLVLRLSGLSHDLDAGYVYHPDTPKQIDATRRFLAGSYSFRFNHPDYDGYPYLNSHLVEYGWRAIHAAANAFLDLIGAPPLRPPGRIALYWSTRVFSAAISTLAIAVIFALGRQAYGTVAGLVAALYLALSPADVAAAHYEISDTTAAFFALVSVLFALRIHDRGRPLDSALAGLFAAAAFAAKYHAGVAIVPAVLAHISRAARERQPRRLFRGLAIVGAAMVGGLLLAIPTLGTDAPGTVRDILGFLRHTSTVNLPLELEGAFADRFLFSLSRNGPVLADIVGLEVLVVAVAGLAMPFGDWRRRLVLASLPMLYFFVLVPFRPKAPPMYHILMTPLVFLFAAATLTSAAVAVGGRARKIVRIVAVVVIVISASARLGYSLRENFFFARHDTRRMAREWTDENLPPWFAIRTNGYTFERDSPAPANDEPAGRLHLSTNLRPLRPGRGAFFFKRFHLEEAPLPVFRNPTIDMFLETPILAEGFRVPVLRPLPARSGNDFIFDAGPHLYRREKELLVEAGGGVERTLVTQEPLEDAVFVLQAGELPTTVDLVFGGLRREIRLAAAEARWVSLAGMERSFASRDGIHLYGLRIHSSLAPLRVTLATTPLEKGVALYAHGYYREAHAWLAESARADGDPEIAALAVVSRELSGTAGEEPSLDETAGGLAAIADASALNERYGGSPAYLDQLRYDFHEAEALATRGFRNLGDGRASRGRASRAEGADASLSIPLDMFEVGRYAVKIRLEAAAAAAEGRVTLRLLGSGGEERMRWEAPCREPAAPGFATRRFEFEIPEFESRWQLDVVFERLSGVVVDSVEIVPDPVAEARTIERLRSLVVSRDPAVVNGELAAYEPLSILADRLADRSDTDGAFRLYRAAAELRPDAVPPLEGLLRIEKALSAEQRLEIAPRLAVLAETAPSRVRHEVDARFEGDVRLVGYRLDGGGEVKPGGSLGVALDWELAGDPPRDPLVVWMHFIDSAGRTVFQGDHDLEDDLRRGRRSSALRPPFHEISVAGDVAPGSYQAVVGLARRQPPKKLGVLATEVTRRGKGVLLPLRIRVR